MLRRYSRLEHAKTMPTHTTFAKKDFKKDHFVSTHTLIAYTNINELDLDSLFDEINVDEDLVHVLYRKREKGEKKKRKVKPNPKNFLNCISLTFRSSCKKVNLKLFKNGVIQLTGCKGVDDSKSALLSFWKVVRETTLRHRFDYLECYLVSVMRNINFNLGFSIDREKLGNYVVNNSNNYVISQVVGGFIGMRFVILVDSIEDMPVYRIKIENEKDIEEGETVKYEEFLDGIKDSAHFSNPNSGAKNKASKKYITVTIFQTGRVLFSGPHEKYQDPVIDWFFLLVEKIVDDIKVSRNDFFTLKDYLKPKG